MDQGISGFKLMKRVSINLFQSAARVTRTVKDRKSIESIETASKLKILICLFSYSRQGRNN